MKRNFWLNLSAKQRWNPCSESPPVYQNLSMHHDWPVEDTIVDFPVRFEKKFEMHFQSKDIRLI